MIDFISPSIWELCLRRNDNAFVGTFRTVYSRADRPTHGFNPFVPLPSVVVLYNMAVVVGRRSHTCQLLFVVNTRNLPACVPQF